MMGRLRRYGVPLLRLALGVALLAYLVSAGAIDWSSLGGLLDAWKLSALAFVLLFLVLTLVSQRLRILLAAQGFTLPLGAAIRLTLIGGFFSAFLPGSSGGDLARIYLAARPHPGYGTEIATVLIIDRVVGALSLLSLPPLAALAIAASGATFPAMVEGLLVLAVLGLLAVPAVIALGSRPSLRHAAVRWLRHVRLDGHAERFLDTVGAFRGKKRAILTAFSVALVTQALLVTSILLLARATSGTAFNWWLVFVVPFGMLANALPITPGGLGVGEAAFAGLFASVGVSGGAEALIAWRILTTLFDLLGGGLFAVGHTGVAIGATQDASQGVSRGAGATAEDG
ncbi:MAG: YbhN family protein [Gemmatimonadota bacterium]